jgi:hypothetical protein
MISVPEPLKSPQLVKSNSSSCFQDLKKCQSMDNFMPEDHGGCHDHLVVPKSTLSNRKISTKSMPAPASELTYPKFTISSSESGRTTPLPEEKHEEKQEKCEENELSATPVVEDTKPDDIAVMTDIEAFLASCNVLNEQQVVDVIDNIYESNRNILNDFQAFLEKEVASEQIENEKIDLVESDIEVATNTYGNSTCTYDEIVVRTSTLSEDEEKAQDTEGSDELREILPHHMLHVETITTVRRESIEDVDNWFKSMGHDSTGEELYGSRYAAPEVQNSYDTNRQFPFGQVKRVRNDSSSELFDVGLRNRSGSVGNADHEEMKKKKGHKIYRSEEAVNKTFEITKANLSSLDGAETTNEHSTLLRFLGQNDAKKDEF